MALPLALFLASAALSAAGAASNARARREADAQQAAIIQNQRQAFADERAAVEQRQDLMRQYAEQDERQAAEQRQLLRDTMEQFTPEATQEGLEAEQSRLAQEFTAPVTAGALNEAIAYRPTPASDPLSSQVVDDYATRASESLADSLGARLTALADMTGYGTFGQQQAIRLGQGEQAQNVLGGLRQGTTQAADRVAGVLGTGEKSLRAAGSALGNEFVPLDTGTGDMLLGLGQMAGAAAGADWGGMFPGTQPGLAGTLTAANSPWVTPGTYGVS